MKRQPRKVPARDRLLHAAAQVFARDGLAGATTRAIAKEAGVNEVTLFRHFQTKERLLAAVVGNTFGAAGESETQSAPLASTKDLGADLTEYARRYAARLTENLLLVRTVIGEIHRHRGCEHQALHGIFKPLRTSLVERLEQAQRERVLRKDANIAITADLFNSMIFTGVLKRSAPSLSPEYSSDEYLKAAVETLLRGIAVSP
jgi:AcrR family transcriptional regulator